MIRLAFSALLVLSLACGDDDGGGDSGPRTDTGTTDTGTDTGTDTSTDAAPVVCGGFGGATCGDTEYCDYRGNICGAADGTGMCRPRPEGCPDVEMPVCACDGTVYSNECEANAAGFDVQGLGGCTPPTETFGCGYLICSTELYCREVIDDTGMPPAYSCETFPATCDGGGRDCICVADEPCGDICEEDGDGNVTVTCPGG